MRYRDNDGLNASTHLQHELLQQRLYTQRPSTAAAAAAADDGDDQDVTLADR